MVFAVRPRDLSLTRGAVLPLEDNPGGETVVYGDAAAQKDVGVSSRNPRKFKVESPGVFGRRIVRHRFAVCANQEGERRNLHLEPAPT